MCKFSKIWLYFWCFRKRVVAEKGTSEIESYMLDDHEMLKRAAAECMCNMVLNEDVSI